MMVDPLADVGPYKQWELLTTSRFIRPLHVPHNIACVGI
jgi:hypothetical protein